MRNLTSTQPELGSDVTSLAIQADSSMPDIAHISITDLHDTRWRVPQSLFTPVGEHACRTQTNFVISRACVVASCRCSHVKAVSQTSPALGRSAACPKRPTG